MENKVHSWFFSIHTPAEHAKIIETLSKGTPHMKMSDALCDASQCRYISEAEILRRLIHKNPNYAEMTIGQVLEEIQQNM